MENSSIHRFFDLTSYWLAFAKQPIQEKIWYIKIKESERRKTVDVSFCSSGKMVSTARDKSIVRYIWC